MSRNHRVLPLPRASLAFRGFTLIELLVVLVIILVLIGILVPALSSSRNTARRVASQSQLKGIAAAIESYATTFNTYPGYFSEAAVHSAKDEFTSNENLVLSLMGGIDNNSTDSEDWLFNANKIYFHKIGEGPRLRNGRKVDAFYAAKPDELQVIRDGAGNPIGSANEEMPELVDLNTGMPILYYRAIASGSVPVDDTAGGNGKFALENNELYLDGVLHASEGRSYDQASSLINPAVNSSVAKDNLAWAVTNQKLSSVPATPGVGDANNTDDVVAGKYVLISPGVDGIYFSADQLSIGGTEIKGYDQIDDFDDVIHVGGQ